MKWKRPLFALVTFVAFFALIELALFLMGVRTLLSERDPFAGFSERVSAFELVPEDGIWRTPPRARRHSFNDQQFLAEKPAEGLRIFSIGGSSAYGFPWGANEAFPHILGQALTHSLPDRRIESINAAAMSYGSHRLRVLIHELLRYEPDLIVIYSGHNEFIERSFYDEILERPRQLNRLLAALSHSRLFSAATRFLERMGQETTRNESDSPKDTGTLLGLDVRRERPQEMVESERAAVVAQFSENLGAIIDLCESAHVGVLLATVPSNLSGWRPNNSAYPAGLTPPEIRRIDEALGLAEQELQRGRADEAVAILDEVAATTTGHALSWYLRGGSLEQLGRFDEAHDAYVRARDLDSAPSRAGSDLNAVIRALAVERNVPLVDMVEILDRFAPDGLAGFNLFEDYVHPKPQTHQLIAESMWQELLRSGLVVASTEADPAQFWEALGLARPEAIRLTDEPLAASGEQTAAMLFNIAVVLENQGAIKQAEEKYRACLKLHPGYFYARSNLARLLFLQGHDVEAEAEYRQVVEAEPEHLRAVHGLGLTLRRLGRIEEALKYFERATEIDSASANSWQLRGLTLIQLGRTVEAADAFARAVELDPSNANIKTLLGAALLRLDRLDEADALFAQALRLDSGNIKARNGLAAVLAKRGRLEEAEQKYQENLRLDPEDQQARRALAALQRMREN